ncbi:MAG: sensor histidine kinase [Anaerolineales bacterium]|nr:sensor histidine kinase [Anaerolineales bacterium]
MKTLYFFLSDGLLELLHGSWYLFLILAVGLSFYLLMTAARHIGNRAAIVHINRWLHLPSAILQFFDATSVDAALIGLMDTLSEILRADGSIVLTGMVNKNNSREHIALRTLAAEGSLRSSSDRMLEEILPAQPEISQLVPGSPDAAVLIRISPDILSELFLDTCPDLGGKPLLVLRFRLHFAAFQSQEAIALMLFEMDQGDIDPLGEEILSSAVAAFPRMLETMTVRFAYAEELEEQLKQSRLKDEIFKQMLNGFQHDISHALSNLEEGVMSTWEVVDELAVPLHIEDPEAYFEALLGAVRLTSQVAASGMILVDTAGGTSALAAIKRMNAEELFIEAIQPLLSLRKRARRDLAVHVEIAPDLPPIEVDRVAFFRVISNVLNNAFKFTEKGGIRILISHAGGYVTFSISDTGAGIPADEICKLGERCYRASNAADIGGSGLGLWTVKQLMERMGGSMEVRSKLNMGSTILLHFPEAEHSDGEQLQSPFGDHSCQCL